MVCQPLGDGLVAQDALLDGVRDGTVQRRGATGRDRFGDYLTHQIVGEAVGEGVVGCRADQPQAADGFQTLEAGSHIQRSRPGKQGELDAAADQCCCLEQLVCVAVEHSEPVTYDIAHRHRDVAVQHGVLGDLAVGGPQPAQFLDEERVACRACVD